MSSSAPDTPADGPPPGLPCTHIGQVAPEWIDYNGHMNVAYYVVLMDRGMDGFMSLLGIDADFIARHRQSTFALDMRVFYRRELMSGARVRCFSQLFGHDEKRMQVGNYLTHAEEGWVAAYSEWVCVQVDIDTRHASRFRPEMLARLAGLAAEHRAIPRPVALARPFGLRGTTASAG